MPNCLVSFTGVLSTGVHSQQLGPPSKVPPLDAPMIKTVCLKQLSKQSRMFIVEWQGIDYAAAFYITVLSMGSVVLDTASSFGNTQVSAMLPSVYTQAEAMGQFEAGHMSGREVKF